MPLELVRDPGLQEITGPECFLCGSAVVPNHATREPYFFSPADPRLVGTELPCHRDCLLVRGPLASARIYHQRVADTVGVPRANAVQRFFARLLLGVR